MEKKDVSDFIFRLIRPEESGKVYQLWHSLVGTPGCAWTADYPARADADNDAADGALYGLFRDDEPAAAGVIRHWREHDAIAPWQSVRPCDLMRIGVRKTLQGQGVAQLLMRRLLQTARKRNFDGMRILVSRDNPPAIRLYDKMGAVHRGEAFAYNIHWLCREIVFQ